MPQLLTLSRAARLIGIARGALQKHIQRGELTSFDGMVSVEDLLRLYPQARLEDNSELERLTQLRDNAYRKRIRERILPEPEVLAARLSEISKELGGTKTLLAQYRTVIERLRDVFAQFEQYGSPDVRSSVKSLRLWLQHELDEHLLDADLQQSLIERDTVLRFMAANVKLLPSGHEFFVEGASTILDAALRSGLALEYGCSNGNCGQCRARVVTGQVMKTRVHDFVLSEGERQAGYVLMCCNTAVTDLVLEAAEAGGAQDIPLQQIATRVKVIEPLAEDMALVHLQTPRTKRLRFLAGQRVMLAVDRGFAGEYPIASCPCDDRNLHFHIRKSLDDPFSVHVFNDLKPADVVSVEGPSGDFVLEEESPRSLLFIAYEAGFAPVKSLIEHAMALDVAESMHLYWLAGRDTGHYMNNLCRAWADALDNFRYTPFSVEGDGNGATPGMLAQKLERVAQDHPELAEFDVYVAGPDAFVAAARAILFERGLPPAQLRIGMVG